MASKNTYQVQPQAALTDDEFFARLDAVAGVKQEATEKPKESAGVLRTAGDLGLKATQGVVGLGQAAIGLGNLATGGLLGKGMRKAGYDPERTNQAIGEYLSDSQKESDRKVQEADGFFGTAQAMLENPRSIIGGAAQSAPGMLLGGGITSAVARRIGAAAAAPLGGLQTPAGQAAAKAAVEKAAGRLMLTGSSAEGAQAAGQIAEKAEREGRGWGDYVLPSVGAGIGTAAIGRATGKLMGDSETAIFSGAKSAAAKGSLPVRVVKSGASEGIEETLQSGQQQSMENIALGKEWDDEIDKAMGQGLVVGSAMGLGTGAFTRADNARQQQAVASAQQSGGIVSRAGLAATPDAQQPSSAATQPTAAAATTGNAAAASPTQPAQTPIQASALSAIEQALEADKQRRRAAGEVVEDEVEEGDVVAAGNPAAVDPPDATPPPAMQAQPTQPAQPASAGFSLPAFDNSPIPKMEPAEAAEQRRQATEAQDRRRKRVAALRLGAYNKNPMMEFLGRHGLQPEEQNEFAPGNTERRKAAVYGYGPVFRKNGKPLDLLLANAQDEGFLPPDSSESDLRDLVSRTINGERVEPLYKAGIADDLMQRLAAEREAKEAASYEDYLREHGQAVESGDFDPLDSIGTTGYDFGDDDLADYAAATPPLQAEVSALAQHYYDLGFDPDEVLERLSIETENQPDQAFHDLAKSRFTQLIEQALNPGRAEGSAEQGGSRAVRQHSGQAGAAQADGSAAGGQGQAAAVTPPAAPAVAQPRRTDAIRAKLDDLKSQGFSQFTRSSGRTLLLNPDTYETVELTPAEMAVARTASGQARAGLQSLRGQRNPAQVDQQGVDVLQSYSPADVLTQEEQVSQQQAADQAERDKAQAQARADDERRRIEQASYAAADSLELGQNPLDSLTGQQDIFGAAVESGQDRAAPDNALAPRRGDKSQQIAVANLTEAQRALLNGLDNMVGTRRATDVQQRIAMLQADAADYRSQYRSSQSGKPASQRLRLEDTYFDGLISQLEAQIADLEAILPEAQQRDERDERANVDRGLLRGARAELEAAVADGSLTPEQATSAVAAARNAGSAAEASEMILDAADGIGQPSGRINSDRAPRLDAGQRSQADGAIAADLAGKPINAEWTAFDPQSGTLGIPRAEMPQIKAEHRGAMMGFLKARGIDGQQDSIPSAAIKPTQAEFSPAKVKKAIDREGGNRSIIVSADGYVVDGHHQWLAAREKGEPIQAIRLDQNIGDVLAALKDMPSAQPEQGAKAEPVAGLFDGKPDPRNSAPLQELDGFQVGEAVDVPSRTIGRSQIEVLFKRTTAGTTMDMARIVNGEGKKLDVLTGQMVKVEDASTAWPSEIETGDSLDVDAYRARKFGSDDSHGAQYGTFYAESEDGTSGYGGSATEVVKERVKANNVLVADSKRDALEQLFGKNSDEVGRWAEASDSAEEDAERVADEMIGPEALAQGYNAIVYPNDTNLYGNPTRSIHYVGGIKQKLKTEADPYPLVTHTTTKGKTLRGFIVRGMTLDGVKASIDPYALKKDGGVFVREQHKDKLPKPAASDKPAETPEPQGGQGEQATQSNANQQGGDDVGSQWSRMTSIDREAVALRAKMPKAAAAMWSKRGWEAIDPVIQEKLAKAMQSSRPAEEKDRAAPQLSLDAQLAQVNDELAAQGVVQNAVTRRKRDQLREAIAQRDFPEILQAVDGSVDMAEALHQAFQFAGNEPKAQTIERVLKYRGISEEYRKRWADRILATSDKSGSPAIQDFIDGKRNTAPMLEEVQGAAASPLARVEAELADWKRRRALPVNQAQVSVIDKEIAKLEAQVKAMREFNGQPVTSEAPAVTAEPELEAIFDQLDGITQRTQASGQQAAATHPRAERIQLVQKHILDILEDLEDSGKVTINC